MSCWLMVAVLLCLYEQVLQPGPHAQGGEQGGKTGVVAFAVC